MHIQQIGVIGAGQMGTGIAQLAAAAGFDVQPLGVFVSTTETLLPGAPHLHHAAPQGLRWSVDDCGRRCQSPPSLSERDHAVASLDQP